MCVCNTVCDWCMCDCVYINVGVGGVYHLVQITTPVGILKGKNTQMDKK